VPGAVEERRGGELVEEQHHDRHGVAGGGRLPGFVAGQERLDGAAQEEEGDERHRGDGDKADPRPDRREAGEEGDDADGGHGEDGEEGPPTEVRRLLGRLDGHRAAEEAEGDEVHGPANGRPEET
jgi:hypothetical protein